jgi:hypothetical protein
MDKDGKVNRIPVQACKPLESVICKSVIPLFRHSLSSFTVQPTFPYALPSKTNALVPVFGDLCPNSLILAL